MTNVHFRQKEGLLKGHLEKSLGVSAMHSIIQEHAIDNLANSSMHATNVRKTTLSSIVGRSKTNPSLPQNKLENSKHQETLKINEYLVTPIRCQILNDFLNGYDMEKAQFLIDSVTQGFSLNFLGPRQPRTCRNLLSAEQHKSAVKDKLKKEVCLGRIA